MAMAWQRSTDRCILQRSHWSFVGPPGNQTSLTADPHTPEHCGHQPAPLLVYTKPEDEFFHRRAAWSFTFDTPAEGSAAGDLQPMRLVMAVTPQQARPLRPEHHAADVCPCHRLTMHREAPKRPVKRTSRAAIDWQRRRDVAAPACQGLDTAPTACACNVDVHGVQAAGARKELDEAVGNEALAQAQRES